MKAILSMAIILACIITFGQVGTAAPADQGDQTSVEAAERMPRSIMGASWSGCQDAARDAMSRAQGYCSRSGGIRWYDLDRCRSNSTGFASVHINFLCATD